ncbi:MAG: MarR family transcriptional regulator [Armatimonadota bacterium]|nr:MarR family transcriptional regulator [Armatimonadota bacterium]MDW8157000.1 MarR family transcriptional regulator [Armatimonadota bacterium]
MPGESVELLGLEARAREEDHKSIRLWLRLLSATNLVKNEVQSRLRRTFGTTLARFDLLAQLERYPEGLAMGPLSKRMMVTAGNVTRLVDQLEREGLVVRLPDPRDRRAVRVRLTPEGRRRFARMAAVHEGWIVELFGRLTREERDQLYGLLAALKRSVGQALAREGGRTG